MQFRPIYLIRISKKKNTISKKDWFKRLADPWLSNRIEQIQFWTDPPNFDKVGGRFRRLFHITRIEQGVSGVNQE